MAHYDWNGDGRNNAHDNAMEHRYLSSAGGSGSSGGGTRINWKSELCMSALLLALFFQSMDLFMPMLLCLVAFVIFLLK